MEIVRAKAPARVSFAGGGTDTEPYMSMYGGCVISCTINKYSYVTLRPNNTGHINIESLDLGSSVRYSMDSPPPFDGKLDLAKVSISKLMDVTERTGIDVVTSSEVPPGSGLGTSSTMMVALIAAIKEYTGMKLSKYEIAHLAYKFEREDLGLRGGHQDQYAAAFGGFNFIEFSKGGVLVTPLRLPDDVLNELQLNLLLCYTGENHISANIIEDQSLNVSNGRIDTIDGMHMQVELATEMKNHLMKGFVEEFGRMLGVAWNYKKKMSSKISNDNIDAMYELAVRNGALGGKLLGAGAGGYLLLFVPPERQGAVKWALTAAGGQFSDLKFDFGGCQSWSVGASEVYRQLVSLS
ncbi:GHMP kinase [Alicyclobacillus curvatus]|nr:GHMP kinase [Alicyclobacillus curvatus]